MDIGIFLKRYAAAGSLVAITASSAVNEHPRPDRMSLGAGRYPPQWTAPLQEWVARRVDSPHVLKAGAFERAQPFVRGHGIRRRPDAGAVDVLHKALHPSAAKRQGAVSEFAHDLQSPGQGFLRQRAPPLLERHPVLS